MTDSSLDEYFICGGFGGMCSVLIGHPFDTIKVRMQTMPTPKPGEVALYSGSWNCFRKSIENDGLKGLFKGMGLPLFSVTPMFAVSFLTYGIGKKIFGPPDGTPISFLQTFEAGAFSGIFVSVIAAPNERIKCLLQIQQNLETPNAFKGPLDCARRIYKSGGLRAIYKGLAATYTREIPATGIYFLTYETIKKNVIIENNELRKNLMTLLAGGTAGVSYWVIGLPADIIKSRLQTAPEGDKSTFVKVFKELTKKEGIRGLYRGMTPVMIRAFVASAACFLGFDMCKQFLNFFFANVKPISPENVVPLADKPNKK